MGIVKNAEESLWICGTYYIHYSDGYSGTYRVIVTVIQGYMHSLGYYVFCSLATIIILWQFLGVACTNIIVMCQK